MSRRKKQEILEEEKTFRLNINVPSWLNDELMTRADHLSMSRNSYINMILAKYINDERMLDQAKMQLSTPTAIAELMAKLQNNNLK